MLSGFPLSKCRVTIMRVQNTRDRNSTSVSTEMYTYHQRGKHSAQEAPELRRQVLQSYEDET